MAFDLPPHFPLPKPARPPPPFKAFEWLFDLIGLLDGADERRDHGARPCRSACLPRKHHHPRRCVSAFPESNLIINHASALLITPFAAAAVRPSQAPTYITSSPYATARYHLLPHPATPAERRDEPAGLDQPPHAITTPSQWQIFATKLRNTKTKWEEGNTTINQPSREYNN